MADNNYGLPPGFVIDEAIRAPSRAHPLQSAARGVVDMATFGMSDELAAISKAALLGGDVGRRMAEEAEYLDQVREDNPGFYMGGQIVGSLPWMFAGPFAGTAKVGLGAKAANASLVGAGMGGLHGFGSGTDLPSRVGGAAVEGGLGGTVGAVAPVVAQVVGAPFRSAARRFGARGSPEYGRGEITPDMMFPMGGTETMNRSAAGKVADAFMRDQPVTERLLLENKGNALGPEAVVADLGPNLREQAAALASMPGRGQTVVRGALEGRAAGAGARIEADVAKAMGASRDVVAMADDIVAQRARSAAPAYKEAYAQPIAITPEMAAALNTPAARSAVVRAERLAANEQAPFNAAQPGTRELDYVKRALDDAITVGRRTGKNQEVAALVRLKTDIVAGVDAQNPAYAMARRLYAGPSEVLDALENGQAVFERKLSPDALRKEMRDLSDAGREAYVTGARQAIDEVMGTAVNDAGAARRLLETGWNRQKVAQIVGKTKADALFDAIEREGTFQATKTTVTGNSVTAARLAAQQEFKSASTPKITDNTVGASFTGMLTTGARQIVAKALGRMTDAEVEELGAEAAKILMSNGAQRTRALNTLQQIADKRRWGDIQADRAQTVINYIVGSTRRAAPAMVGDEFRPQINNMSQSIAKKVGGN